MWFTFVMAHLFIFLSFQPRLAATLLRSCSVVNNLIRRAGLSPAFQPTSLAQRLDHFEGRHWLGWYHHVTLVSMAFAFLRSEQARAKKNFWCDLADDPQEASGGSDPPLR